MLRSHINVNSMKKGNSIRIEERKVMKRIKVERKKVERRSRPSLKPKTILDLASEDGAMKVMRKKTTSESTIN